ncbi:rod shape-determining protein MreD [uncultured Mitsuokella sp.]|uniref:rod shape-determining protein MreD n=1 Tax=uncultured Mitsuokella sp. TaxID=453120 RepID=UPI0025F1B9CE|nr:rod shape-determining protein MreD [uncultured Mitsuokella sp.]
MKQAGVTALFVIILYALQTSLLPLIAYHGVTADLLLLFTTSMAFLRGARIGALAGFSVGLLQDLVSGTFLGMNAFTRLILGFLVGKFSDEVFKEQFFLPVFASLLVTVANYFILALLMLLLGYRFNLMGHMQYTLLPMLIYQLVFAYPVHRLTYELNKRYGKA